MQYDAAIIGADGVYLIGEAAGFISASSFEGISSAMGSGSALAFLAVQLFREENNDRAE